MQRNNRSQTKEKEDRVFVNEMLSSEIPMSTVARVIRPHDSQEEFH